MALAGAARPRYHARPRRQSGRRVFKPEAIMNKNIDPAAFFHAHQQTA